MADKFDVLRGAQRRMRMDGFHAGPEPLPADYEDLTEEQLASLPAADVHTHGSPFFDDMDKTTSPRAEAGGPGETPEEIERKSDSANVRLQSTRTTQYDDHPGLFRKELQRLVPGAKDLGVISYATGGENDIDAAAPLIVALHRFGADVDPFVLSLAENMIDTDKTADKYRTAKYDNRDLLED